MITTARDWIASSYGMPMLRVVVVQALCDALVELLGIKKSYPNCLLLSRR
ncbi:MAG: hypothetical protein CM1200mP35_07110 [Chloroflexota bacterium]|nr:MAG: hypothetical protein CM1200mP35_07110 [Chloroflexota bacterium]